MHAATSPSSCNNKFVLRIIPILPHLFAVGIFEHMVLYFPALFFSKHLSALFQIIDVCKWNPKRYCWTAHAPRFQQTAELIAYANSTSLVVRDIFADGIQTLHSTVAVILSSPQVLSHNFQRPHIGRTPRDCRKNTICAWRQMTSHNYTQTNQRRPKNTA